MAILPLFCTDMPRKLRFYQPKQRKDDRVIPQPAPLSEKAELPLSPLRLPLSLPLSMYLSAELPDLPSHSRTPTAQGLTVCNCLTLTCIIQFNIMFPNSGCRSLSLATSTSGRLVWQHERASLKWKRMECCRARRHSRD